MTPATGFIAGAALAFTPIDVDGLFIDGFAGGGGASTGIAWAIGRDPDIAVNHSETALAIHRANHPNTEHHCTDIRMPFLPKQTTRGRHVAGAWFSPDCKEFSKAKGGPVKDRSIRALCWEVVAWLRDTRPTCGYLENVEEFEYAAPLDDEGRPIPGAEGREFKRFVKAIRALGYRVKWKVLIASHYGAPTSRKRLYMVMRNDGKPIVWPKPTHGAPDSPGVRSGKLLPYRTAAECIDWSIPCPSIFDRKRELADATKRRIAHGVMRYVVNAAKPFIVGAGGPIYAGKPRSTAEPMGTVMVDEHKAVVDVELASHITKFRTGSVGSPMGKEMPTVTANGEPERPAGAVPLGRVDAVLAPVITYGQQGGLNRPADKAFHAVTASAKDTNAIIGATLVGVGGRRGQSPPMPVDGSYPTTTTKGDSAIACATMVKMGNGEREGQAPRALDIGKPMFAPTAKGSQGAAVTAFLSSFYSGDRARDLVEPMPTAMADGAKHGVVCAHIEQANGGPRNKNSAGHDARKPLSTTMATGSQQRVVETTMIEEGALPPAMMDRAVKVAAFLVKYYGSEVGQHQAVDKPIDVVTTLARYAVVTVTIDAKTYVIVDIGLRMLKPRELANAQGFPPNYKLNPVVRKFLRGKWVERELTIAEQISAIGNSVCPPVARALVVANQPSATARRMAA